MGLKDKENKKKEGRDKWNLGKNHERKGKKPGVIFSEKGGGKKLLEKKKKEPGFSSRTG
ncbi:hypothetical protein [Leptospira interrogans]|uniref:hypothetical protein n=1 Tax=Leptospira interrogans TaxID=173 RepID=UPI00188AEE48|nr:hypothetical protein [Leptospira interrogans]MBF3368131.1 hypothetical protein [Leptospira interrogans serovar Pomona]